MTAVDTPATDRSPRPKASKITDVGSLSRAELRDRGRALRDHAELVEAVKDGHIEAIEGR